MTVHYIHRTAGDSASPALRFMDTPPDRIPSAEIYRTTAVFARAEAAREWDGFDAAEAHGWVGALLHLNPHPVSAQSLARAYELWCAGEVPTVLAWADTAREARSAGFTPTSLKILRSTLGELPPEHYSAHPRNHAIDLDPHHASLPFDAELWRTWPGYVADGLTPPEATRRVLDDAEELLRASDRRSA